MKDSDPERNTKNEDGTVNQTVHGPIEAFQRSIKLFFTKDMGLLSVAFFYMGNFLCPKIFQVQSAYALDFRY